MGSVETFGLRVKLLNLRERISEKYMEIRWLGERAHIQPSHAQSEEANSLARRLPSRMGSVETFRLRVKLLNLRERISEKYMEIRWLGERAHIQSLLSTLPLSVYPWQEDSQTIAHDPISLSCSV